MPYQDREHIIKAPSVYKTLVGLASGSLATSVVHPYDLLKTRMQLSTRNLSMTPLAKCIVKNEGGYGSLYKGLPAALARNVTNTAIRLGAFYTLSERYKRAYDKWPSLYDNIVIGLASGILGAVAATPAEVVVVRMMGDAKKRTGICYCDGYSGVANGIQRILQTDGVPGLWQGGLLTLLRSVLVSTVHIYSYKKTHQKQKDYYASLLPPAQRALYKPNQKENVKTHVITSVVSSFFTCVVTLPVDLVKTKNYHERPPLCTTMGYGLAAGVLGALAGTPAELVLVRMMGDGTQGRDYQPLRYKGLCDGIKKIMACKGILGLWRGAGLSALRSAIISCSLIYTYTKVPVFATESTLYPTLHFEKRDPMPQPFVFMERLLTILPENVYSHFHYFFIIRQVM